MALFANRTPISKMRSNLLRLYYFTIANAFMTILKEWGAMGTELVASAPCVTIRTRLLKIAGGFHERTPAATVAFFGASMAAVIRLGPCESASDGATARCTWVSAASIRTRHLHRDRTGGKCIGVTQRTPAAVAR